MEVITKSEKETFELAYKIASELGKKRIVCLNGELGAGKTVFVKGFCSFFGISEIWSPTFTIVNEYSGNQTVYHFDVYRWADEDEFYAIGGEEYFEKGICIIEWSDLVKDAIPADAIDVRIDKIDDDKRKIVVSNL